MSTLSLVIPVYTIDMRLEEFATRAILTLRDQVDEIIVVEDGGMYSNLLLQLADVYIYNKKCAGFSANVNRGWKFATSDYVAIVNSDIELRSGNLQDLCIPGKITSPEIVNQKIPFLAGPFWVAPKEVTKERGMLLEDMRTYCSDSDYDHRVRDIFVKVPSVKIYHHQAQTVSMAGVEGGREAERDQETYQRLKAEGRAK